MSELFIIPQKTKGLLARIVNGKVELVNTLEIPYKSISRICENGLIVTLCIETNELLVHSPECLPLSRQKVAGFKAMNVKGNIIYLGGAHFGETFSLINMNTPEVWLQSQELPVQEVSGKRIDDILILGNKLVLLDNVLYPKYLFEYDITEPEKPVCTKRAQLAENGTYEHIIKGDINEDYMVVFSDTSSRSDTSQHIIVTGKRPFHLSKTLVVTDPFTREIITEFPYPEIEKELENETSFKTLQEETTEGELSKDIADQSMKLRVKNIFKDQIKMINSSMQNYQYIDLCVIKSKLYLLRSDCFGYIDLDTAKSENDFELITLKSQLYDKLIKLKSNNLILAGEENYALLDE